MLCGKCGKELPADSLFCPACGTRVPQKMLCISCGRELEAGSRFCPYCGSSQEQGAGSAAGRPPEQGFPSGDDDLTIRAPFPASGVPVPRMAAAPTAAPERRQKSRAPLLAGVAAFVAVAAAGAGILALLWRNQNAVEGAAAAGAAGTEAPNSLSSDVLVQTAEAEETAVPEGGNAEEVPDTASAGVVPPPENVFYDSGEPADAEPETETPAAPATEKLALLQEMEYIGDPAQCAMGADQARAFANVLAGLRAPVLRAALFDGGGGIPLMWVAYGDSEEWNGNWSVGFMDMISGNFNDQLYAYSGGAAVKCPWMTMLLRTGENGVVLQQSYDYDSEFATHFKMYHLSGGTIAAQPFAYGGFDPFGSVTLNDQYVGTGEGFNYSEWSLYTMADANISTLLSATTGPSGMLILSGDQIGSWIDGDVMRSALLKYAEV